MTILILGANGYVGSNLVNFILANDHETMIRCFDENELVNIQDRNNQITHIQGDICKIENLDQHLDGVDIVFHFFGKSLVRRGLGLFADDYLNDVSGTIKVINAMIKNKVRKIVFLSSGGTVYGDSKLLPIKETFPLNPISTYGFIKVAVENILQFYQQANQIDPMILRVSSLYGPHYNKVGKQGVIATFINNVKRNQEITVFGTGQEIRDYVYIDDLIVLLSSILYEKFHNGIFNVASGIGTSTNQIIEILKEISTEDVKISYIHKFESDVSDIILDIEKVKTILNWNPEVRIKQGILKCWHA